MGKIPLIDLLKNDQMRSVCKYKNPDVRETLLTKYSGINLFTLNRVTQTHSQ